MIKAVWTDFGGVLTPPVAHTFAAFCTKTGLQPEPLLAAVLEVTARYGTDDIMLPLDTPLVTEDEWIRQIAEVLSGITGAEVEMVSLADTWFDGRETNHLWLEELHRLRDLGLFVGMLSNMPPAWDAHWRRMVPPEGVFADVVSSAEVGHRKPDRKIFELAAARAGVLPHECVLVDDLAKNCAGAEAAGWQAVHFTDTPLAIKQLSALLTAA
ncbi:haloacid dehalogenase [Microtetraspora sp. NBRC 13810]|uniref:HAD family hydrolase n=1 Tax=Microtetraspora sp. NBRC 13810 TaxID=3030990 RepID=UPI0024A38015|nr:HAD family phosphatase [Microtetraspora sp. NBRC 13810]GLW11240.1 haloacid dehalogenase [Microtetraspora sp. NBRC 13810]